MFKFRAFRVQFFTGLFLMILAIPLAYLATDKTVPYEYDLKGSWIKPPEFNDVLGQQMTIHWSIIPNRVCPGTVHRIIVDTRSGVLTAFDPVPTNDLIRVTDRVLERTFFLPPGMAPGDKVFRANLEFSCNWLQRLVPILRVRYTTPDLPFKVT